MRSVATSQIYEIEKQLIFLYLPILHEINGTTTDIIGLVCSSAYTFSRAPPSYVYQLCASITLGVYRQI